MGRESSPEQICESRRVDPQQSRSCAGESVTNLHFRKATFLASEFCLINVFFFFFNVLRGWGTLQLVVMRPTGCRERDGGELRALHMLLVIALTFQQTHKHTNHAKVFGTEFYSCHGMIHQECLHCFVSAVEVTLWGGEVKSLVLLQVHCCCCLCFFFFKEITRSKIVV